MTSHGQTQRQETGKRAGGKRARPPLPVREILAAAARAGWRDRWRVIAVAVVVSTVAALLEIVASDLIDRTNLPLAIVSDLSATSVSTLGAVFLSGFLCRIVGHTEHGHEHPSIRQVLASLPWVRLVLADLLVVLIVAVGVLLLVIPGLIAFTLLAVVAPVIEIEDRPVHVALRRSAHLVRPHFWWVALLATVPLAVMSEIESITPHGAELTVILEALAIRGLGDALIEAAIGLTLVALCYRLMELDAKTATGQAVGDRTE